MRAGARQDGQEITFRINLLDTLTGQRSGVEVDADDDQISSSDQY